MCLQIHRWDYKLSNPPSPYSVDLQPSIYPVGIRNKPKSYNNYLDNTTESAPLEIKLQQ